MGYTNPGSSHFLATHFSVKNFTNMTDCGITFKVYLRDQTESCGNAEVRRFAVDREVSANFADMRKTLATVFPELGEKVFTMAWTDEDGDIISIDCDEELLLALGKQTGPVYRLIAIIMGTKPHKDIDQVE